MTSSALRVAFRADASLDIGTGHVMRCLTLAEALREQGAECVFVSRAHPGNLLALIRQRGFKALELPAFAPAVTLIETHPPHAAWLGCGWHDDAAQTAKALADELQGLGLDWLIVDHYALDARWEQALKPCAAHLLVIDDLADRPHDCDVLLDQNLGRKALDYAALVPARCELLIGPAYALLRPEFAQLREQSLARRKQSHVKRLLITLGGVDKDNATSTVLKALASCPLPQDCEIDVVMGANAPWLVQAREQAARMPRATTVSVNVQDMARRMAAADLAVGAAGSTSWERCCLGLPSLIVVLAANQLAVAKALQHAGAALLIGPEGNLHDELVAAMRRISHDARELRSMAANASAITAGEGAPLVLQRMDACERGENHAQSRPMTGCHARPMTHADLEAVLTWRNHPDVRRYMLTQHEITLEEHAAWFERARLDATRCLLIVEEDGKALGFVQFSGVHPEGVSDWGFYAAPGALRGSGRKLGRAALDYAFNQLALRKVRGQAMSHNEASIRLHEALGFQREGARREQSHDEGQYHELLCYGLSREEWLSHPKGWNAC
jgi:UDP-2,4-diacetamido-2,4,6-trideoxy-beta-L-altropyranose hydrolase/UDP-4-amino-4,6-dideoxy-N-acetyl-beta-L-altrosamine N-acetyltransferase